MRVHEPLFWSQHRLSIQRRTICISYAASISSCLCTLNQGWEQLQGSLIMLVAGLTQHKHHQRRQLVQHQTA